MTLFDKNAIDMYEKDLTRFKSYTRLLTCSNNMEKSNSKVVKMTYERLLEIIANVGEDTFVFYDGHFY